MSEKEHTFLYDRAVHGSRKDAASEMGVSRHAARRFMAAIFAKLGVEDTIGAFRAMGWLKPIPYGTTSAEVRHERLDEGEMEHTEHDFWKRMNDRTKERG